MTHPIPRPCCQITANDKPLDALIQSRIMSVTVTDNRSMTADQLEIVLNDHDGALMLPKRGVELHVWLGWSDGVYDKGKFIVDGSSYAGTPDVITVRANSADFTSALKTGRRQSYHQQSLGQVADLIAKRHGLTLVITDSLASIDLGHVDQTDESDINLITRLARDNGAEATIKQKKLLIFKAGTAQTASGKKLPAIVITRADGDQFNYDENDRDHDYTGVVAYYHDDGKARRTGAHVGSKTKEKRLKGTFANAAAAEQAAQAEKDRIGRSMATFSINKAIGVPELSTETPVHLFGFKALIDALDWIAVRATHHFDANGGLNTSIEMEAAL